MAGAVVEHCLLNPGARIVCIRESSRFNVKSDFDAPEVTPGLLSARDIKPGSLVHLAAGTATFRPAARAVTTRLSKSGS
jgi:hypothetical protein